MKNKTIKRNLSNKKNKTKKSHKYGGSMFSKLSNTSPFKHNDENINLQNLKVILNGFYYGYNYYTYLQYEDPEKTEYVSGLSNTLKQNMDIAILTISGDNYEINYLASEQDISGQRIMSSNSVIHNQLPAIKYYVFNVENIPNVGDDLGNFKNKIQFVYNGFKAPKYVSKFFKTKKYKERENIEIAIIYRENDAYKVEFIKDQPYREGYQNTDYNGIVNWEEILTNGDLTDNPAPVKTPKGVEETKGE